MNGSFRVYAGWLLDGTGGPARTDVLMHIEGGVIIDLRKIRPDDKKAADGIPVVDLSGSTVLPGLVDCHVHLTMSGVNDSELRKRQLSFSFDQARPVIAGHLREHLARGVVAVRDGGDSAGHTLRYKNERRAEGSVLPVRLRAAGKAWRARGRYGRLMGRPPAEGLTLQQCIASQDGNADHVKLVNSGLNSLTEFGRETAPQFGANDLEGAVRSGRERGLGIMVHANGKLPVRLAVEAGCRSIEHGFFMGKENMQRMADLQVCWVPTAFSMKAFLQELPPGSIEAEVALRNLEHQLEQLAYARELGVPVAVGTDCGSLGIHHGASFVEEMRLLVQAGFTIDEAIRSATLEGARLLGLDGEIGYLHRGAPATFVAAPGAPSALPDSLRTPGQVYVRGCPVV